MVRASLNMVLLFALVCIVAFAYFVRRDYTERNDEILPGMVDPVPYEPQSANPNFSDGKTLQPPVKGTITRATLPLHYKPTPEDALRAGEELKNPFAADTLKNPDRAAFVFSTFCQPCHGSGGLGDGTVAQRGFPPPPSFFADRAMRMKDGQVFHLVTYGQGNMPSLAAQVSVDDRWRVVEYLRTLQSKKPSSASK